jgi:hypothetical protein
VPKNVRQIGEIRETESGRRSRSIEAFLDYSGKLSEETVALPSVRRAVHDGQRFGF